MESKNIIGCHWSTQFICLHFVQITTFSQLALGRSSASASAASAVFFSFYWFLPRRRGGVFRKNIDQEKIKWLNIEQFLESEM